MVLEMLAEGQIFMCSTPAIPLESSKWSGFSRSPIRPMKILRNIVMHALLPVLIGLIMAGPADSAPAFPGKVSQWNGFTRYDFQVADTPAIVVVPAKPAAGNPWIWRTEFFDHRPEIDLALVKNGFYLVHLSVGNTFGCPRAMDKFELFHKELTEKYGLSKKAVMEGLSRGGLYAYNFAAQRPDAVAAVIGDNPVCDFKSWPGGKGKGPGSAGDWKKLIADYEFPDEAAALAWKYNPVDNLETMAKANIPLLNICGDADEVVPYPENTVILFERYKKLGGRTKLILKPGLKHHPHGLDDPRPAVEWVLEVISGK